MAGKSHLVMHLQNVHCDGCVYNVETALRMIEGVRAVRVVKDEMIADVLYEEPATPFQLREQLLLAGYLAESKQEA